MLAMRLKVFRAKNMTTAMARLRSELGPDALILSTRRVAEGVELTAALEEAAVVPASAPRPSAQRDQDRGGLLAWHGVPESIACRLLDGDLAEEIRAAFVFASLRLAGAPLLLVGPPGAGKTLMVAKLATRLVLAGTMPLVITADGKRAGATEQLAAFTRLLGLQLIVAHSPVTLARALTRRQGDAPVLIDGPGIDPNNLSQMHELADLAGAVSAAMTLVLPSDMCPGASADLAT